MSLRRPLAIALTASIALAGLTTLTATGASGAAPAAKVQPRVAVTNTSAYAIIGSVSLPGKKPYGVAVNGPDDTVYVTNFDDSSLSIINGQTLAARRLGVGGQPLGVAVNQSDDTVYVGEVQDLSFRILNGRTDDSTTQYLAYRPEQIAVDQDDDTVYVTTTEPTRSLYIYTGAMNWSTYVASSGAGAGVAVNDSDDTAYWSVVNPTAASPGWLRLARNGLTADDTGTVGLQPYGVAVNQSDDTIYVANRGSGAVPSFISAISGRNVDDSTSIPLGFAYSLTTNLATIAVDQGDDTIYTANASGRVLIINGRNTDDSGWVALPAGVAYALAVDDTGPYNKGFIYAGSDQTFTSTLYVIAPNVSPTLLNTSGSAGTPVTVSLSVPNLAPSFDLASTTVLSIKFGATNGTSLAKVAGTSTWSVVPPAGSGTVDVVVTFAGGKSALAGSFTYSGSPGPGPGPAPASPPGAPTGVTATAGDASAIVSWVAPIDSGSYPISDYEVTSSPASRTCVVMAPATSCAVTGLTNGTSYTFTVRASSAAGAGPLSAPSNAVIPFAPRAPGAPTAVSATAGNAQALVSWTAPTDSGTSSIVEYEAVSSPGGVTCLVNPPATSCTVAGLTNGTSYTFTVRARNAVGWGTESSPSNAVTPRPPTILITGSRDRADDRYIRVQGTTTDLVGTQVTPYVRFPGQTGYTAGIGIQTVASDGTFTWQRKTGKKTNVYFMHGEVRSNTVTIRAR